MSSPWTPPTRTRTRTRARLRRTRTRTRTRTRARLRRTRRLWLQPDRSVGMGPQARNHPAASAFDL